MKISKTEIIRAALEAGIMISTQYGQGMDKMMPVTDTETLEKFVEILLKESKCNSSL